ncbi:LIP-domain-containing protein [Suhomyces tanzawaensis NRRL Y-17324]|uniref:LIP-domain-containing protein n=1 Tax=Suhomyces tanzawaensis NRRL Y-17324 TaxID=984487 RepID=A0A1E4SPA2_9ASCO|nr:LIP-domain-containing protein [Suhomyces tanzawaensis NRRL Y-17324]ODV81349.1 LIP-domain-containing protein [Suhomyces tanzawaensis NRRL Y-17324]
MKFPFAGLVIDAINGLANEYPLLMQYVKDNIYPAVQQKFFSVDHQCLIPSALSQLFTNWNQLTPLGVNVLQVPVVKNVTNLNNLLNLDAKPSIPFFFYNAKLDEIVPATDADKLFTKWCSQGVSIQYNQDLYSEHITQAIFGAGDAFSWIKDRFDGKTQSGCRKRPTISNALNFQSLLGFNDIISGALRTLFAQLVGPNGGLQLGSYANLPAKGNDTDATRTIVQGVATSFAQSDIDAVASGEAVLVNAPTKPDCAPSYALQTGSDPSTWISTQIEQVLSEAGLYEGWVVVVPDFLGPKGAFGVGLQAAHATLNSLKAVVSSNAITGASKDAQIALWGYSGGSQPTVWAGALAPTYAPGLNIVGATVGGLLNDLEQVATTAMKLKFAVDADNSMPNDVPKALASNTTHPISFSGHSTQAVFSVGSAFRWIKRRIEGEKQSRCNIQNTTSNTLNFELITGFKNIRSALITLYLQEVSPNGVSQLGLYANLPAKGNNIDTTRTIVQGIATVYTQFDIDAVASSDAILVNAPASTA